MEIIRYNQEDIVPVTLKVISMCTRFYLSIAFKFALKYHLPDLEGTVDADDDIDETSLMVLHSLDDAIIGMILSAVNAISEAYAEITLIHLDHSTGQKSNDHQMKLAIGFYGEFVIDLFQSSILKLKIDGVDANDYEGNLLIFIESLIIIVHALQDMITTGEVDTERVAESSGRIRIWDPGNGSSDLHSSVLRVLKTLADSLYKHRREYIRYCQHEN